MQTAAAKRSTSLGRRLRDALTLRLAPPLISAALRLLGATLRIRYRNADRLFDCWQRGEPTLLTFWHDRVLLMPMAYRGRGIVILNSLSRDGEIATRVLRRWGIDSMRGSASRGGAQGFLQLVRAHRRGRDLALIPDGPRGPRHQVKPGVIHLARATGAQLFPVSYGSSRALRLGTWDRLMIPLPFARIVFTVGPACTIDRHADDRTIEAACAMLQRDLDRLTAEAEAAASR